MARIIKLPINWPQDGGLSTGSGELMIMQQVEIEALEERRLFAHILVTVPDAAQSGIQQERAPHLTLLKFGDGSVRFGRIADGTSNT